MENKELDSCDILELSFEEYQNLNGGSPLSYWVFYIIGNMADTPNRVREAGANPVVLFQ